jgi:2-C-methyl-D-erythritol 2,4-cyclodiphosphate synthase
MRLLAACAGKAREAGYELGNVAATIVVEAPKLAPHLPAVRASLAAVLNIQSDACSVTAKTSEGMGYTGDGSGVAAYAVALLYRGDVR